MKQNLKEILKVIESDINKMTPSDSSYLADIYWDFFNSSPASRTVDELIIDVKKMIKTGL